MNALLPLDVIRVQNTVGEGILWDAVRGRVWWTDIQACRLHRYDWDGGGLEVFATPQRVGSFGLVCGSESLITAFESGIAMYDVPGRRVDWLYRPELAAGTRFNDGRADRAGRFWAGTMVEGDQGTADGCLFSFDAAGGGRRHLQNLTISNGLCMSPDGTRLYVADSAKRVIMQYELREPEGVLTGPHVFARTPDGAYPDGATVDAAGCVWSAQWGASRVVRYSPDGRVDRVLAIPTRQPSCVCFAGPDLDILMVTSAREGLSPDTLAAEPNAGDVFLYRAGVQGLAETEYAA